LGPKTKPSHALSPAALVTKGLTTPFFETLLIVALPPFPT
jgi:hypothetical protein